MELSNIVDFKNVTTAGMESSPVAEALAGTIRGSFFVIKGEYSVS